MAVTIRFARVGKRHSPIYRIVVQDKQRHPTKSFIELLGNFYPLGQQKKGDPAFQCKIERLRYWLERGALCSPRVQNLLKSQGVAV